MKIGIDARPLSDPLTGIGQYTYQLICKMLDSEHELILFSHKPLIVNLDHPGSVKVITNNITRSKLSTIWAQTKLPSLIKKEKIDVFWSPRHHLPLLFTPSIPMVVSIHDLVYRRYPQTMRKLGLIVEKLLLPRSANKAKEIITISNSTAKDLIEYLNIPREKINVIYTGVKQKQASISTGIISKNGLTKKYILFIGTLEPRKNLKRLMLAYSKLPKDLKDSHDLALVGGRGWGKLEIEKLAKEFNIEKNIKILGYLSEQELSNIISQAIFLAMPSLYEGFGLPILEAMQYKIPVLTSGINAMAEAAADAAVLVDPLDVNSICLGMQRLLTDANLRAELISKGEKRVKLFSWDKAARQTLQVLEKACLV